MIKKSSVIFGSLSNGREGQMIVGQKTKGVAQVTVRGVAEPVRMPAVVQAVGLKTITVWCEPDNTIRTVRTDQFTPNTN